jgi:hypothetical protein
MELKIKNKTTEKKTKGKIQFFFFFFFLKKMSTYDNAKWHEK